MGNLKRILSKADFIQPPLFDKFIRIESAEEMHVHWRDLRVLMTPEQFTKFCNSISIATTRWNGKRSDVDTTLINCDLSPTDGIVLGNSGVIEEQADGNVHLHYRDARLELTPETFITLAELFMEAYAEFCDLTNIPIQSFPIDRVVPWDGFHKEKPEDWFSVKEWKVHEAGILFFMEGIKKGGVPFPIAVRPIYNREKGQVQLQRYDGFKRYMAMKRSGWKNVPCLLVFGKYGAAGCQHGCQPWSVNPRKEK